MSKTEKTLTKKEQFALWETKNKILIHGKEYDSIKDFVKNDTPYHFSHYNNFRTATGIRIVDTETADKFLHYMKNEFIAFKRPKAKFPLVYKGVEHTTFTKLFETIGCKSENYQSYVNTRNKTIVTSEDIPEFVEYLQNRRNFNKKISISYDGETYPTLKSLIEYLGYKVHNYAYYRLQTGNEVRSAEDVQAFIDYMKRNSPNKRKPIKYDNFNFRSESSLCKYLGIEIERMYYFKQKNKMKKLKTKKDVEALIKYVTEDLALTIISKSERIFPDYRLKSERMKDVS